MYGKIYQALNEYIGFRSLGYFGHGSTFFDNRDDTKVQDNKLNNVIF